MTPRPRVLHLVDDTTAGGVMRVLDFIRTDPGMAKTGQHVVRSVRRGHITGKMEDADVVVSHLTVCWRSLPSLVVLKAKLRGIPFLHVEHSYTENFVVHNVKNRLRFKMLLRAAYALFDRIICVSFGQAAWMKKTGLKRCEAVCVIQSCVDLEAFRAVPRRRGPVCVFGAIGRLEAQKGFDDLIRAFRACADPDIALHVVGTGSQEPELRALAEGDTRIIFKEYQADTTKALAQMDVVVMPSRWEAYGLVAIEALAAGRTLLCSNVDGLKDHAMYGSTTVPAGCARAFSQQLSVQSRNAVHETDVHSALQGRGLEERFCARWGAVLKEVC